MKSIMQDCVKMVKDMAGHEFLYFDTAIEIRTSPHVFPFRAWGACAGPNDELYVMDNNQEWHKVEPDDRNTGLVVASLYQRLKLMHLRFQKDEERTQNSFLNEAAGV